MPWHNGDTPMSVGLIGRASGPRAPMPPVPARGYSFTDWQVNNPTAPPPGDKLDGEYDRTNASVAATITWASVSLNTDGTVRDAVIGENNLVSGLFDDVAQGIIDDVRPLVDEANAYASAALGSSRAAQAAATAADTANAAAQGAANLAADAAADAAISSSDARAAALDAAGSASAAANAADTATGSEGVAYDYALVTQAWAEHMPDTIPPNILAVMGVTGDHWSSRWWANYTAQAATDHLQDMQDLYDQLSAALIASINQYYLGGLPAPPTGTGWADGCMYFDTGTGLMMVWDGYRWVRVVTPVPGDTFSYVFVATNNQTVFTGTDYYGKQFRFDPAFDRIAVYLQGAKLIETAQFVATLDTITTTLPVKAGEVLACDIILPTAAANAQSGYIIDTHGWALDGVTQTFMLISPESELLTPYGAADVFIAVDGVWQAAGWDYTVAGSNITFTVPPAADSVVFGTCGMSVGGAR
jgi:hypothetical protein